VDAAPEEQSQHLRLTFLRDILLAAADPEAETFPLLELASFIIRSPLSPTTLRQRFGPLESV